MFFFKKDKRKFINFQDWYIHEGSQTLDSFLLDLMDVNLKVVPIENLLDVPKDLPGYSDEDFCKLLASDGVHARIVHGYNIDPADKARVVVVFKENKEKTKGAEE